MKISKNNPAVAEIVGAMLLLVIAVAAFSVIYLNILSNPGPSEETYITIIGSTETILEQAPNPLANVVTSVIFKHQRGEGINLDSIVQIKIAGIPLEGKYPLYVSDLLDDTFEEDGKWNIGEPLIYEFEKNLTLKNVEIEATIIDKTSNSIVFWGILQPGYVIPPYGRGGIWHFNESHWDGTLGEVRDSSGNRNHGTAYYDANTVIDNVSGLTNRSGYFNYIDGINDFVVVPDAYSLDLKNQVTMEAWIKPYNFDVSGIFRLENKFGITPYITHVYKNVYVVVSEDQIKGGIIQTVNITPYVKLSDDSLIDKFEGFGLATSEKNLRPIVTHASNDIYLIAYIDKDLYIHLKTFNISLNGIINYTGKDKVFIDTLSVNNVPNRPSIIKVTDEVFAIAYWSSPSVGILKTVKIYSNNGTIEYTGNMIEYDKIMGYEPNIIHVDGDVFAIAYRGPSNKGFIKTFNISSDGAIEYTGNILTFDDIKGYEPSIIHVDGDVFAIAYRGPFNKGIIKTFNIYSDGNIKSTGSNNTFESSYCFNPHMIYHSENYYIIVYATDAIGDSQGKYITIEIADNGSITNIGLTELFDQKRCYNPLAIKISDRIFAVVYEGFVAHTGNLITVIVEYPSDVYSKGIYKYGSYGIYANATKVFVNINKITINASIIPDSWNYVVLTYDKNAPSNQMKLYVNGTLKAYRTLIDSIKITDSNLLFGDLFYGLIDEIAIHDIVLSEQKIKNHYINPGVFENEPSVPSLPPIISNVASSEITYNSAKITWDTDKQSNSTVIYSTTTPPTNIISDSSMITSHSIVITGLLSGTKYFYEVQSTDQEGYTVIENNGSNYYTFTTENRVPNVPSNPNPVNGAVNVNKNAVLSWTGGDPDGDTVTYDVYFGTTNLPPKVVSNQSGTTYDPPGNMNSITMYYWKIVAWDNHGASTDGPIWNFTTK